MKLNILGMEYDFEFKTDYEDARLTDKGGYIDPYAKKIVVLKRPDVARTDDCENLEQHDHQRARHEIIHAHFFESGLWAESYGWNEEIVDWIAAQFPKMLCTMITAECIGSGDVPVDILMKLMPSGMITENRIVTAMTA